MTNFRLSGVRQTPWACGPGGDNWYACVHAEIEDEVVIDTAKRLVDRATPQRLSTFHGGHYYSFVTREHLLNLLLYHYQSYGLFPTGSICVVEEWLWECQTVKTESGWSSWLSWKGKNNRSKPKPPAYWIQIPSVQSVLANPSNHPQSIQRGAHHEQ